MPCSKYLTDLATSIWTDLGSPSSLAVSTIQSKLTSQAFLGKFNVATSNCYCLVSGDVSPVLNNHEQGIYAAMYEVDYYTLALNSILNGSDVDWVSIADGDSRVVRSSNLDRARLYRDQQKNLQTQLNLLINTYRKDNSTATSSDFLIFDNSWNGPTLNGAYVVAG